MKKKIKKFIDHKQLYLAQLKKFGKKFKKTPELQLAAIFALGILSGALIIFGFTRDSVNTEKSNTPPHLAQYIAHNQNHTQLNQ